jgi:hypothetical protein
MIPIYTTKMVILDFFDREVFLASEGRAVQGDRHSRWPTLQVRFFE